MGFNIGRFIGGVAKVGAGFALGGPAGAGAAVLSLAARGQTPDSVKTVRSGAFAGPVGFGTQSTTAYFGPNPIVVPNLGGGGAQMPMSACPTGFRLNKSAYVTRGGGTSRWPKGLQLHAAKSTCVKRRKINAGNGRA